MKILVVEDDVLQQISLRTLLQIEGHEMILAENSKEGLELYEENKQHIGRIYVHSYNPITSGLEFLAAIRAAGCDVHICFAAENLDDALATQALQKGATCTIQKPFASAQALLRCLNLRDNL